MTDPAPGRPHMPGYGIADDTDGALPWNWARERLESSRNYWVATTRPGGRPHLMPVWGVWMDDLLYFSTAITSTKARNMLANPECSISTEHANEAVIVEGVARVEDEEETLRPVWAAYKQKYDWDMTGESMFVIAPALAFGFIERAEEFGRSATRWQFGA